MVQGNTVHAKHAGRGIMAGLKNIFGDEPKGYTELLTEAREADLSCMSIYRFSCLGKSGGILDLEALHRLTPNSTRRPPLFPAGCLLPV